MHRITRYDKINIETLKLADPEDISKFFVEISGEQLLVNGRPWKIIGESVSSQIFGYMPTMPQTVIDEYILNLRRKGINCLSVFTADQHGTATSGIITGQPVGPWKNGISYVPNRVWSLGDSTWTTDSTGISRVYKCSQAGTGSGASTGPTGTGTNIVDNTARWDYQYLAFSIIDEVFFVGNNVIAGFDYFLDACCRANIKIILRMDSWPLIFKGQLTYPLNAGTAGSPNLASNSGYLGNWHWQGEYGTVDYLNLIKTYLLRYFGRINSKNGKRYGNDPVFMGVNPWNEIGLSYWYLNTSSTSSPSSNTFDNLCKTGSPSGASAAEPVAGLVSAWDAAWLAWYQTNFPGHTPDGDFPGQLNTLPTYAYQQVNGLGVGIAARKDFRTPGTGTAPADTFYNWRCRVIQFLMETEANMVLNIKAWLRQNAPKVWLVPGQSSWMFPLALAAGDLSDTHMYDTSTNPNTTGNTGTATGKATGGGGASWVANVLTVLLKGTGATAPDASHPLVTGQFIRVTAGGLSGEVVGPITALNSTDFTAPRVGDPGGLGSPVDCSVILPSVINDWCSWHAVTPGVAVASSLVTHVNMAGSSAESDVLMAHWPGNANFGQLQGMRNGRIDGLPVIVTELGKRGLTDPYAKGMYRVDSQLFELLQGGAGVFHFSLINGSIQPGMLEHALQGDGSSNLQEEICALISRPGYVPVLPNLDITQVTIADICDWYAAHNPTQLYAGLTPGWANLVSTLELTGLDTQWNAFMFARLRHKIAAASAKTNVSYTYAAGGATFGGLTDPSTGRLYLRRDVGYYTWENDLWCRIAGRLPANFNAPDNSALTKLSIRTTDGKLWYGHVTWVSLDGSKLGTGGRSALYTWMYPVEEATRFRRFTSGGTTQAIETLDGDAGGATDAGKQPGVIMRNGLQITLATGQDQKVKSLERNNGSTRQPSYYSAGTLKIMAQRPRLIIG
jgi:hypothetical protein